MNPNPEHAGDTSFETTIPPGVELWLHLLLRKCLKQPLNTAVTNLSDDEAMYVARFIEGMSAPLSLLLEAWGLPQLEGAGFWRGEVLPLLNRKLNPPPRSSRSLYATDSFKAVKEQADIEGIARRYTELQQSGDSLKGLCPLHAEKTPSFRVYPDKQTWHCYGACGRGGDVIELVRLLIEVDLWQAH